MEVLMKNVKKDLDEDIKIQEERRVGEGSIFSSDN